MPTKKISRADKMALKALGKKVKAIILQDKGYKSLDAFALELHDMVTKPTLYEVCSGKRDMKFSTLLGISRALDIPVSDLLKGL